MDRVEVRIPESNLRILNVSTSDFIQNLSSVQERYFNSSDREKVFRFLKEEDRRRATGSIVLQKDYILKHLLGETTVGETTEQNNCFQNIKITYSKYGKPGFGSLTYNVSHDHDLVVLAWLDCSDPADSTLSAGPTDPTSAELRIGVDIMKRRPVLIETFADCLTKTEKNQIERTPHLFFDHWCSKEALTKAFGLGLGIDFRKIEYDANDRKIVYDSKTYSVVCFDHCVQNDASERYVCAIVVVESSSADHRIV